MKSATLYAFGIYLLSSVVGFLSSGVDEGLVTSLRVISEFILAFLIVKSLRICLGFLCNTLILFALANSALILLESFFVFSLGHRLIPNEYYQDIWNLDFTDPTRSLGLLGGFQTIGLITFLSFVLTSSRSRANLGLAHIISTNSLFIRTILATSLLFTSRFYLILMIVWIFLVEIPKKSRFLVILLAIILVLVGPMVYEYSNDSSSNLLVFHAKNRWLYLLNTDKDSSLASNVLGEIKGEYTLTEFFLYPSGKQRYHSKDDVKGGDTLLFRLLNYNGLFGALSALYVIVALYYKLFAQAFRSSIGLEALVLTLFSVMKNTSLISTGSMLLISCMYFASMVKSPPKQRLLM